MLERSEILLDFLAYKALARDTVYTTKVMGRLNCDANRTTRNNYVQGSAESSSGGVS
jgi:hypothetical protein